MILPCLFTFGSKYGDKVIFGILNGMSIHPVRTLLPSKVRSIGAPKLKVKPALHIIALGDECHELLDEADLLEPLLNAMAEDMYQSTKKLPRKNSKAMAVFTQEYKAASEAPVVDLWGNVHD